MKPARDRILAAAMRIHRKKGIEALSLRGVAQIVGITPMAIYRHFRDKDALIEAMIGLGFAQWEERLADAALQRTPMKRIEEGLLAYGEFALAEPRMFELMFLVPRPHVPRASASLATTPSRAFALMIAAVKEAIDAGLLRQGEPAETILFCWATAHGMIALHFSGRFGHDDGAFRIVFAKTIRDMIRLLVG
jgi:AcrR family transcriptional regulator